MKDLTDYGNFLHLAGIIFAGGNERVGPYRVCMFPGEGDLNGGEILQLTLEEWQALLRQLDLRETEVIANGEDGKTTKAILRKSQRQIEQRVSWAVYRRDSYACRYCAADDVPLTVDHLVLWEEGGPSCLDNLVTACRKCNRTRGNMPYVEWLHSPHYKRVSQQLSKDVRRANEALADALPNIPRRVHRKSR